jgi:hypothetical protein
MTIESLWSWFVEAIKKELDRLSRPPTPSSFFAMYREEDDMSHIKTATILLPQPRQDELDFESDTGKKIVTRTLTYSMVTGDTNSVDLPLTQPSFEIKGVPAGTDLIVDLFNKTEDGKVGHSNHRVLTAPPAPKVIPVPDAVDVQWADEPDAD